MRKIRLLCMRHLRARNSGFRRTVVGLEAGHAMLAANVCLQLIAFIDPNMLQTPSRQRKVQALALTLKLAALPSQSEQT